MLPLGNRVQQKLESLVDKHMATIGACKLSLSSISSEYLWRKTGRFVGRGGELFAFKDRKDSKLLLSPTHEEEITALVATAVQSYKDLPLRLYQISRKYRDEARPRQGLLRGREFIMKDLYTFDHTDQEARQTYERVQLAYRAFFDELNLPYLVARADSGSMGGNLSHEYHFVSPKGEDNVIHCGSCGDTINDELAMTPAREYLPAHETQPSRLHYWSGISKDRSTLIMAWFPLQSNRDDNEPIDNEINVNVVKEMMPEIDLSVEDAIPVWTKARSSITDSTPRIVILVDGRIDMSAESLMQHMQKAAVDLGPDCETTRVPATVDGQRMQLTRTMAGDVCQSCGTGRVTIDRAIEIGHTFHLGTRYSHPLDAAVVGKNDQRMTIEMGCHGIGVSRLVAAIASILSDARGLNWPASIAPFQAVIIPGKGNEADAEGLYRSLRKSMRVAAREDDDVGSEAEFDAVLDDRNKQMGWKLNDADLVGYPLVVVLGRAWKKERKVEVQCRRLEVKEEVEESDLAGMLSRLLQRL